MVVTAKKPNYANATFSDITDSTNNGSVTVTKISLNKPTATGSYTYNLTIGNTSANLNKSVYAVGYITYRDKQGDVHTVYTEVVEMAPVTN